MHARLLHTSIVLPCLLITEYATWSACLKVLITPCDKNVGVTSWIWNLILLPNVKQTLKAQKTWIWLQQIYCKGRSRQREHRRCYNSCYNISADQHQMNAGVGQPKYCTNYCNNAYVHVVLTNLCSTFSIFYKFFGPVTIYFDPTQSKFWSYTVFFFFLSFKSYDYSV